MDTSTTSPSRRPLDPRPLLTLREPADVIAAVPHLLGFRPGRSVVVLGLAGARQRLVLTVRVDLLPAEHDGDVVEELVTALRRAGAGAALMVVHTDGPAAHDRAPGASLARTFRRAAEARGIELLEALAAGAGRFRSLLCADGCCPPGGLPLPADGSGPAGWLAAQGVFDGRVVLPGRHALAERVSRQADGDAEEVARLLAGCPAAPLPARSGPVRVRTDPVAGLVTAALGRSTAPPVLSTAEVALIVHGLTDVLSRDLTMTLVVDLPHGPLLDLLCEVARRTPDERAAPVCSVIAWTAHAAGQGALANVALERALASDPAYSLALVVAQGLARQLEPRRVLEVSREVRRSLRRRGRAGSTA